MAEQINGGGGAARGSEAVGLTVASQSQVAADRVDTPQVGILPASAQCALVAMLALVCTITAILADIQWAAPLCAVWLGVYLERAFAGEQQ